MDRQFAQTNRRRPSRAREAPWPHPDETWAGFPVVLVTAPERMDSECVRPRLPARVSGNQVVMAGVRTAACGVSRHGH